MKRKRASTKTSREKKQKLSPEEQDEAKQIATEKVTRRHSARLTSRHDVKSKPVLSFKSKYTGVRTQKRLEDRDIKFEQSATLAMTTDAPHAITHYYELRQEVKDSFNSEFSPSQALGAFVQDGPYCPDYKSSVITVNNTAILFKDTPGFSTVTKIVSGDWLNSYDVYFRWIVTDKTSGNTWTSPEVHHQMASAYNGGADVAVTFAPHGEDQWEVDLPDRPTD
jgi:hypothetical protein